MNSLFLPLLDKLAQKFQIKLSSNIPSDSSNSRENGRSLNNNSKAFSLDEKSTIDIEENINHFNKENEINIIDLLSLKDKAGNTPMLFAAFKGNLKAMKKMISFGLGFHEVNNAGLNIIHMAAQSDSSNIIVYFKEKYNFDLFQNDYLNNNAIHWACSSGSKSVLDYLMLYINKNNGNEYIINSVNSQGQTALHITILTSGSISTIKKLLKKGIDLNIKDNNDMTVNDLVKDKKKFESIEKIIYDYTNKGCFGLNHHINDKRNKYCKYILFIILSILVLASITFSFIPYLKYTGFISYFTEYIFYFSMIIYISMFIYITLSNPGIIPKNTSQNWIEIIDSGKNITKMCPYCRIELGKLSKHCFLCHQCIEIYDHHCHWINNCVGSANKPYFIAFIISLWFNLVIDCYIIVQLFAIQTTTGIIGNYFLENIVYKFIYGGFIFLLCLFFVFPVSYLIYVQFKNRDSQKEVQVYLKEIKELNSGIIDDKAEKLLIDNDE